MTNVMSNVLLFEVALIVFLVILYSAWKGSKDADNLSKKKRLDKLGIEVKPEIKVDKKHSKQLFIYSFLIGKGSFLHSFCISLMFVLWNLGVVDSYIELVHFPIKPGGVIGVVTNVDEYDKFFAGEGNESTYVISYSYKINGSNYEGHSFTDYLFAKKGDDAKIQYIEKWPYISRIYKQSYARHTTIVILVLHLFMICVFLSIRSLWFYRDLNNIEDYAGQTSKSTILIFLKKTVPTNSGIIIFCIFFRILDSVILSSIVAICLWKLYELSNPKDNKWKSDCKV